jgi:hypothetical protein
MFITSRPYFWDEQAAHAKLEEIVWPNGPVCTRCGATDRIGRVTGKGARTGLKFCCRCRKQFRATVGTMFEGSHVPLHKWFQACFLLSTAGDLISPYQLHLRLEVTNKTASGIVHRLAWLIESSPSRLLERSPRLAARGRTIGVFQGPSRGRACRLLGAVGWDELPWMQVPIQPKRQFLRFIETAREFGCVDDEGSFERLLMLIGSNPVNPRTIAEAPSRVPTACGLARPTHSDLGSATA